MFKMRVSILSLFIFLFIYQIQNTQSNAIAAEHQSATTSKNQSSQHHFKLDCPPGEQRHFNYESVTKVWGSTNQQVRLRASLRLRCMEPNTNGTLKYLVEVLTLNPNFENGGSSSSSASSGQQPKGPATASGSNHILQKGARANNNNNNNNDGKRKRGQQLPKPKRSPEELAALALNGNNSPPDELLFEARAEPVFDEMGEAIAETATRMRRSVSGWLSKTWSSVKDFFSNIFTSSERSTATRDEVLNESGLDISNQCRANNNNNNNNQGKTLGLPIDDSVFDDFEPKYYIGASLDSQAGGGYEFATDHENEDTTTTTKADDEISFFDDPKPPSRRQRRATSSASSRAKKSIAGNNNQDHERLLRLPFVFVQSETGKIVEVRFSSEESDLSIKNFKRHLCDLFATNLESNRTQLQETSPIGQHTTKYLVDSTANSTAIKQSLMKAAGKEQEQLVRALALAGMQSAATSTTELGPIQPLPANNNNNNNNGIRIEGREPVSSSSLGDSLSVLRSINSTSNIEPNSRAIAPDINQIEVRVKQIQQISDGRMTGTAGQLGMSLIQGDSLKVAIDISSRKSKSQTTRSKRRASNNHDDDDSDGQLASDGQLGDIAQLLQVSTSFTVQLVPLSKLGNYADMTPASSAGIAAAAAADNSNNNNSGLPTHSSSSSRSLSKRSTGEQVAVAAAASTSAKEAKDDDDVALRMVDQNSRKSDNANSADHASSNSAVTTEKLLLNGGAASSQETIERSSNKDRKKQVSAVATATATSGGEASNIKGKGSTTRANTTQEQQQVKGRLFVEPLVMRRPTDPQELRRLIEEWRQLESKLQLSSSNLLPESSQLDGPAQRLEILRNQIEMRLNEEFMRNKLRRRASSSSSLAANQAQQVAAPPVIAAAASTATGGAAAKSIAATPKASKSNNELGLSLTQLILDSGITAKHKGSVYSTIEEVLELELVLQEDSMDGSVSRLLRDTVRLDKLRSHCKSAIASLNEIRAQSNRMELKAPPLASKVVTSSDETAEEAQELRIARAVGVMLNENRKRLDQCKQVVELLLRVSERQVAELVIDLIDECNNRMLEVAKNEELGYGPTSRYYRNLRQQFTELLANINKPSELLLDKLVNRLHFTTPTAKPAAAAATGRKTTSTTVNPQQEFTYVNPKGPNSSSVESGQFGGSHTTKYNKSLLREEDDYNNNDGAGSLVATITTLAAKPSIGQIKKGEIAEKLLMTLKSSSCSLFNGPDLDILESMGNFHEPIEQIVGKVLHLARRCKYQDQYLVACIHGLQGQLSHPATQRFLTEQLRSQNASCTVKSEIVLTLVGAILINDLKASSAHSSFNGGQWASAATSSNSKQWQQQQQQVAESSWPSSGLNQVDETLLELVNEKNGQRAQDRRCLSQLVTYYMSKKRPLQATGSEKERKSSEQQQRRNRRAIVNDDNFWDEAQCKRWDMKPTNTDNNNTIAAQSPPAFGLSANDLVDEIDDNSILTAMANYNRNNYISNGGPSMAARSSRHRNQRLLLMEREAELPAANGQQTVVVAPGTGSLQAVDSLLVRRRHKCSASRSFGPKNAQTTLKAEIVNDLIGSKDENKFLARFRLAANFFGSRIDLGRMYLWHQKQITRAHVNILGKSLWDTSHSCQDKAPRHLLYMPLFDFNLWLVKLSVGLRLQTEMGFFSNCGAREKRSAGQLTTADTTTTTTNNNNDELELFPTISVRASGEAAAKFVVARAGMSLASHYGYQGNIRVSKQPESCMSIYSGHQPMNVTFSSWFQLWDGDCHYWGSRNKAEPQATKWRLSARKPTAWLEDECLLHTLLTNGANGTGTTPN